MISWYKVIVGLGNWIEHANVCTADLGSVSMSTFEGLISEVC